MIDFHVHSILSDGKLTIAEIVQRYKSLGYKGVAITDHVDFSNIEFVISSLKKFCKNYSCDEFILIPGVEITHVKPEKIEKIVKLARNLGAKIVIVHGETIIEPVEKGTNIAAIKSCADILAHPGLICPEEVEAAKENDVFLELTFRQGHCLTNGHVARVSKEIGARLIVSTDAHDVEDIVDLNLFKLLPIASGLSQKEAEMILNVNITKLLKKIEEERGHEIP